MSIDVACDFQPANEPWECVVHRGIRTSLDEPQCDIARPAEAFTLPYIDNLREAGMSGRWPTSRYVVRRLLATIDALRAGPAALAAEADRGTPDHESKGWPCGNCRHDSDIHSPVNRELCAVPGCDCPGLLTSAEADRGTWREASKRLHDAGDDEDPDETVSHSGHYLDLDSPETADRLAQAAEGIGLRMAEEWWREVLAALREPGQ